MDGDLESNLHFIALVRRQQRRLGLHGLTLSGGAVDATTGSVMTSSAKNVHLDQSTRLLLSSQAAAGRAHGGLATRARAADPCVPGAGFEAEAL